MPITAADILANVNNASTALDAGTNQMFDLLTKAGGIANKSADALNQASSDAQAIEAAKQAGALATQTAKQKIGLDFGTDRNQQNEIYSQLAARENEEATKQIIAKAAIDQKESVQFLDDPFQYVINQLTINGDIKKYNAALSNRQIILGRVEELNKATSDSAQVQTQFQQSVTQASAEAAARNAAVEWKTRADAASILGLQSNVEGIKLALAANVQKLGFIFNAHSAEVADAQLGISREALELHKQEFEFRKEEKLKNDQFNSSIIQSINFGRKARGLPPLDDVRGQNALQMLRSKGPTSAEFEADWKAGEVYLATGELSLADNAADMLGRLKSGQIIKVGPGQDLVKEKLETALNYALPEIKKLDPKDIAGANALLNKYANVVLKNDFDEVKPNDPKNLFTIQPFAQVVKSNQAAADTPIYQKVLKPLLDAGVDLNDPNKVVSATIDAMKSGKITYADAITLTTIYQAGANMNLAQRDLIKFGLHNLYGYNVRINDTSPLGFSGIVDMTKPDVLGRALNRALSARALQENPPQPE